MTDESVFPTAGKWIEDENRDGLRYTGSLGLTKRELFAAMMLQSTLGPALSDLADDVTDEHMVALAEGLASLALAAADALIAKLAKERK